MRIIIDLQGAQTSGSRFRGIGRYTLSFAKEFVAQRRMHEVVITLNAAFPESIDAVRQEFEGLLPANAIRVWSAPQPARALEPENRVRREQAEVVYEAFLASLKPDWVIVSSLFEGFGDEAITSLGRLTLLPTAVILYDLIPWIYPEPYLANPTVRNWYVEKLDHLRRANLLLAISASSAKEAVDYLGFAPDRTINISSAANDFFQPIKQTNIQHRTLLNRYEINQAFVMYTGGIDHRKNIEGLVKAWSFLPETLRFIHQLVVVCHADEGAIKRLLDWAKDCGLKAGELVITGFVPEDDLLALYNACKLFVFPSWHEGFGLPALEAMQCGKPVLAANRSSLPEVIGREDALFDPFDTTNMATKIAEALSNPQWLAELAQHGLKHANHFNWQETSRRAWQALEERTAQSPFSTNILTKRPRLAYVSPLPPECSGIADYSAELLRDLTRWYDIDVVVRNPSSMMDADVRSTCQVRSVEYFSKHHRQYNRVLYHFGNSEFHEHMFELLENIPGCVVLHDFFLSGVQHCSEVNQWRTLAWTHSLYESHGYKALLKRYELGYNQDIVRIYPANLPVLQRGLGVIVHSEFSRRLANCWYGEDAAKNWHVIPHLRVPVSNDRNKARQRLGLSHDSLVIASFGIVGETKLNHRLLNAFLASKLAQRTNVELVFVGMAPGEYGSQLQRAIDQARMNARIRITGWADIEIYRDWLQSTDMAVQLRTHSRGETSGTVLDCLNHGLATIVNAHGSMAELESEVVWALPDEFRDEQLVDALEKLVSDESLRKCLGNAGLKKIRQTHNPRRCAEQYAEAIEAVYSEYKKDLGGLMDWLTSREELTNNRELVNLAECLAKNHPPHPRQFQLLIDITDFLESNEKSHSYSPLHKILRDYLTNPPKDFRTEPIFLNSNGAYYYARQFTQKFLSIPEGILNDEPITYSSGDLLFLTNDKKTELHKIMQNQGVSIRRSL